ncbi:hypothetical protein [Amycolatopsis ultiminotia]
MPTKVQLQDTTVRLTDDEVQLSEDWQLHPLASPDRTKSARIVPRG